MKKIILILSILLLIGCTSSKEDNITDNSNNIAIDKEEIKEEYVDSNPIKLGLFLYDNNYHDKHVLEDTYYTDFISGTDIGSFEVFLTDDKEVDGYSFKDVWNKYYNNYNNIEDYKVGFNIKFITSDGEEYSSNFLEPDIFKFSDYFYVYLYDDVNQNDGAFYSHLEEMNDNTIITSIKLYAVSGIDRVESIILNVFTYKNDNDFDIDGNYRGNSIYVIRIKRK